MKTIDRKIEPDFFDKLICDNEIIQKPNLYQAPEITIRYTTGTILCDRPCIRSSLDTVDILKPVYEGFIEHHEEMYAVYMNRKNRVLGVTCVSKGGLSGTLCDPKIVFQTGLKINAAFVLLSHNHPSGDSSPSPADTKVTQRIKELGNMLELPLLDHIILTVNSYYSYADEGNII